MLASRKKGSVMEWLDHEAEHDKNRNLQEPHPTLQLKDEDRDPPLKPKDNGGFWEITLPKPKNGFDIRKKDVRNEMTIALIAHDQMKDRMVEFAIDYEPELLQFKKILCTGTTGRNVSEATRSLENKIHHCNSDPKGGDIEISTEILAGKCHVVVFFIDPLQPHPNRGYSGYIWSVHDIRKCAYANQ